MAGLFNIKKGIIRLSKGGSCTLDLGSGFLFLNDNNIAYEGFYNIPFWSSEIVTYNGFLKNALSLTKQSSSTKVKFEFKDSFTNSDNLVVHYLFIGG